MCDRFNRNQITHPATGKETTAVAASARIFPNWLGKQRIYRRRSFNKS
jgi:hypothetical protein